MYTMTAQPAFVKLAEKNKLIVPTEIKQHIFKFIKRSANICPAPRELSNVPHQCTGT